MLHINQITIKNFRPYYGIQTFKFGEQDGLSIVLGDNGIGKSSLIRAIKFVLYDEFDSVENFKIKYELNIVAWEEQNFELYVALDFNYNHERYILKRIKRAKTSINGEPKSDGDFEGIVTLIKENQIMSSEATNNILKNVIPKKIAEYILFEGETIAKYKNLLDKNRNLEIYDSIRKILGITTLENSKIDLDKQLNYYNSERIRSVREQNKNQKMLDDLNKYKEQQDQFTLRKDNAQRDLAETVRIKNNCEEILRNNQRIRELMDKKTKSIGEIQTIKQIITNEKETLKQLLKNYKSICVVFLKDEIDDVPNRIRELTEIQNKNKDFEKDLQILKGLLTLTKCRYCGNDINKEEIEEIKTRIYEIDSQMVNVSKEDIGILDKYNQKLIFMKEMLNGIEIIEHKKKIKSIETKIQEKLIEKDGIENKLKDIEYQIESLGGSLDIEETAKSYTRAEKNEELHNEAIRNCDVEIKRLQSQIDDIIRKSPTDIDINSINLKIKKTQLLVDVFTKSIESYSEKMRVKVQNDATLMFRKISENHEYDRLEFDKQYGLKLIDTNNRIVPNISSGYMTLITISLIYGLHKNSTLTGTIILDAPFSVLTNFHRDKIIQTFQTLSPQVLLLVYKDQIDLDKIRNTMEGKLVNEYEIYQDREVSNSSYKTSIREVQK